MTTPTPAPAVFHDPPTLWRSLTTWRPAVLKRLVAPYIAEFLGSFFVVLALCFLLQAGDVAWGPTGLGFVVLVTVYSTASASGGLVNPVVTLAFGLVGRIPWRTVLGYCLAQASAGALAGHIAWELRADSQVFESSASVMWDAPAFKNAGSLASGVCGFAVEALYSMIIGFTALSCMPPGICISKTSCNQFFALAVGFATIAAGHAAVGISPCLFNPAGTLALVIQGRFGTAWALALAGSQILGACGAAVIHGAVRAEGGKVTSCFGMASKLTSEFVGTFFVVLTVSLSRFTFTEAAALAQVHKGMPEDSSTAQAFPYGGMMVSMVYSLCSISGAHFNPAVTVAVVFTGRGVCGPAEGFLYVAMQSAAGVMAGVLSGLFSRSSAPDDFSLGPQQGYTWAAAAFVECSFTVAIALVVLCTTTIASRRYPKALPVDRSFNYGFAVGMCTGASAYACERISGGELNPAISLGVFAARVSRRLVSAADTLSFRAGLREAVTELFAHSANFWILTGLQLAAGLLAALLFAALHPLLYKTDPLLAAPPLGPPSSAADSRGRPAAGP